MASETKPMVTDYERTALATEGARQAKYRRWAKEMRTHGWVAVEPTEDRVKELALHFAEERLKAAREG